MTETRSMRCDEVLERLTAYADGELAGEESWSIRRHLEACPPCGVRAEVEGGFKRVLGALLQREAAPASLGQRVRDALAREGSAAGRRDSRRRAWRLALAAAAGVVALAGLAVWLAGRAPGLQEERESRAPVDGAAGGPGAGSLALVSVHLRGTIVCAPCEAVHAPIEDQQRCWAYGHLNGVRDEQGRLWNLVRREDAAPQAAALLDGRLRGRRVEVDGQAIERISYLIPTRVELR